MRCLLQFCLLHSIILVGCKYSANIPDFTPPYAKDILEFAKKYRYRIEYKHGIKLFRTNETLNVSSEYEDSQGPEYFVADVNSSYELDDTDLSDVMSWMDDKTTPRSVEKMTLNLTDYHFNIDKQFAHQVDYDFNDSFPVASQQYSDDGIQEPCVRNYFVKRNESYFIKDVTDLFSSYERQFLPPPKQNLKWTYHPHKSTTRNFSREHASNPYRRLFQAINTEDFEPMLNVGDDEVTRIDYPTTLTEYREPFFVYVNRLSDTNVTFYHNNRKYYFRDGTMIRDLNGLKYFMPNVTYPMRKTRKAHSSTLARSVTRRKVRSKLNNSQSSLRQDPIKYTKNVVNKEIYNITENQKGTRDDSQNVTARSDEHLDLDICNSSNIRNKNDPRNDPVYHFLRKKLESLLTTTEPPSTKMTSYIQPLFTLPSNKYAPIRIIKPNANVVTFIVKVPHNNSFIFIADKRSLDPNFLASSVIYATNIRRNKEWERNFEHLNMNLFGRHRNHKLFTSTLKATQTTSRAAHKTTSTTSLYEIYDSSLYVEIL